MPVFEKTSPMPVDAATLFAWHARPGALERLIPPWQPMRLVERADNIRDGARAVMDVRLAPLVWKRWVAEHFDYVEGVRFRDRQVSGPFQAWTHTHETLPDDVPGTSLLRDHVEYELKPTQRIGQPFAERQLERVFHFRHTRTRQDLERHASYADRPRLHVAVSGASGAIARRLMPFLTTGEHRVSRLVRDRSAGDDAIAWTPATGEVDQAKAGACDAIVHLAGKSIMSRWTDARKREFWDSRVLATQRLCERLASMTQRPRMLIAASAVGYYGDRGEEPLTESNPPGSGFAAEMCQAWEAATRPAREAGIRVVNLRISVVLAGDSGAVKQMLTPARLGLLGPVGSGRQWMPWIAMDDLLGLINVCLMDEGITGVVDATTASVRQRDFARALAHVLHRPAIAPMPAAVVKALFGQMGQELLLASANVQPARVAGYEPKLATLEQALRFELGR